MDRTQFIQEVVPSKLKLLSAGMQPLWGSMSASEMVDHLRRGVVLSIENTEDEITTPEDKLPIYKRFLMSDKPFAQGLNKPKAYDKVKAEEGDLEALKEKLLNTLERMQKHFEEHPDHIAIHPSFGPLNPEEWMQLHYKHFSHHFTQFELI